MFDKTQQLLDELKRQLDKISTRIKLMAARSLVKSVDDSDELQLVKIALFNETQDSVERVQNYGFTSVPPEDSEAVVLYANGNKDSGIVVACDNGEARCKGLEVGESAQYSQHGQKVMMKANGDIEITMPGITVVGTGTEPVAVSTALETFLNVLSTQAAPGGVPVVTPSVGSACPIAAAIASAMATAFGAPNTADVKSTNLKAD